ncbi:MAG: protein TolR [Candidatus Binatia bacterium]
MAFSGERNNEALSQINVTPLVDVMLVLLVIFMVTAPILQQGIDVNLPRVQGGALAGEDLQLVVTVTTSGALYLNDAKMTPPDLLAKLQAILRERPDRNVYLRADAAVPYGEVLRVMSTLREAGVQRLGMVTEPPPRA